ncbi:CheW domain-containing protein [Stutzerimonas tarimensis]|uniref:CheW domain-containing protein n=1 Tax=Stutzerimonas tarimensis TaxID=1507735 RepID=A0ABV7TB38_9GAMM
MNPLNKLTATRPQLALQSYLDDLLQDAVAELSISEQVPEQTQLLVQDLVARVTEAGVEQTLALAAEFEAAVREERERDAVALRNVQPVVEAAPAPVVPPATPALAETEPRVATVADPPRVAPVVSFNDPAARIEPAPAEPSARTLSGPPAWAEGPFECLLFDVAGLTLAVPLVSLGSIYSLEQEALTPLFGQPDWFLGILPCQAGNLKVLDSARWLMPERYRDDFREGLRFVISVQGYEWGLAVHQVSRSVRLDPREVKWRGQRSQRPWLAGTVIEHMCALLDVAALAELIASGAVRQAGPDRVRLGQQG